MMKKTVFAVAALAGMAAGAAVEVSNVSISQDAGRRVVITYALSADAIVTCTIQTNNGADAWVALPPERTMALSGAVNRKVSAAAGTQTIYWKPSRDFRDSDIVSARVRAEVKAWELTNPPDYMVADLKDANTVNYYVSTNALPGGIGDIRYRQDKLLMRRIRAAGQTFRMGKMPGDVTTYTDETPHLVSFTADYWIGVFEFTYGQVRAFFNASYKGTLHKDETDANFPCYPAESITCNTFFGSGDAVGSGSICKSLEAKTGIAFSLPTEAQWEFAARAGVGNSIPNGLDIYNKEKSPNSLDDIAWTISNSDATTHPVGLLKPNNWGLYDVIGNVKESCRDGYVADLTNASAVDPFTKPSAGSGHVLRGGEFQSNAQNDRACRRMSFASGSSNSLTGYRVWAPCPAE